MLTRDVRTRRGGILQESSCAEDEKVVFRIFAVVGGDQRSRESITAAMESHSQQCDLVRAPSPHVSQFDEKSLPNRCVTSLTVSVTRRGLTSPAAGAPNTLIASLSWSHWP